MLEARRVDVGHGAAALAGMNEALFAIIIVANAAHKWLCHGCCLSFVEQSVSNVAAHTHTQPYARALRLMKHTQG